jgi:hypothetical protein
LTEKKKRLIIDWKKWVFTVQLVAACSFLFLLDNIFIPKIEKMLYHEQNLTKI